MRQLFADPRRRRFLIAGIAAAVIVALVLRRRAAGAALTATTSDVGPLTDPSTLGTTNGLPSGLDGTSDPLAPVVLGPDDRIYDPRSGKIIDGSAPADPTPVNTVTDPDTPPKTDVNPPYTAPTPPPTYPVRRHVGSPKPTVPNPPGHVGPSTSTIARIVAAKTRGEPAYPARTHIGPQPGHSSATRELPGPTKGVVRRIHRKPPRRQPVRLHTGTSG